MSTLSKSYISAELRKRVTDRANNACEYCLIPVLFGFFTPYQMDHVIGEKHGGKTSPDNLAMACKACNQYKGSDIATYLEQEKLTVRLYHPRHDSWSDHFSLNENGALNPVSNIGVATIQLLKLNEHDYCVLRKSLLAGNIKLVPN